MNFIPHEHASVETLAVDVTIEGILGILKYTSRGASCTFFKKCIESSTNCQSYLSTPFFLASFYHLGHVVQD